MDMTDELKQMLTDFSKKYPYLSKITTDFDGDGDSFNGFSDMVCYSKHPDETKQHILGKFLEIQKDSDLDYIMETILDQSSYPDFNDDGCKGTIEIDFINRTINIDTQCPIIEWSEPDYENADF